MGKGEASLGEGNDDNLDLSHGNILAKLRLQPDGQVKSSPVQSSQDPKGQEDSASK